MSVDDSSSFGEIPLNPLHGDFTEWNPSPIARPMRNRRMSSIFMSSTSSPCTYVYVLHDPRVVSRSECSLLQSLLKVWESGCVLRIMWFCGNSMSIHLLFIPLSGDRAWWIPDVAIATTLLTNGRGGRKSHPFRGGIKRRDVACALASKAFRPLYMTKSSWRVQGQTTQLLSLVAEIIAH